MVIKIDTSCVLLIIDLQNDFMPSGSLPLPDSDKIIPVLNRYIDLFEKHKLLIYAIRDWHPPNHISLRQYGGIWSMHCVKDTIGAGFPAGLILPRRTAKISRGYEYDKLGYSAFEDKELVENLKKIRSSDC